MGWNSCEISCRHLPWKLKAKNSEKIRQSFAAFFANALKLAGQKLHPNFALGGYGHKLPETVPAIAFTIACEFCHKRPFARNSTLNTSETLPLRDPLRDPLRGRFPSQNISVLLPLIVLCLETPAIQGLQRERYIRHFNSQNHSLSLAN